MNLKGTKTAANLMNAFAGESMAHTKYLYYAKKARENGYQQMGDIFEETARNEKEHAKMWFKLLHDGVPNTRENLKDAIGGEGYEWREMYPEFAKVAREEGLREIAEMFERVAAIEEHHEKRYAELLESIEKDNVFKRSKEASWKCLNCGHIHVGTEAPGVCPTCKHPQSFFEVNCTNYISK